MISCLQAPLLAKGNDSIVKTIGILVGIYQDQINVQDIYKLIEIVLKHFNDQSQVVQQACAECWGTFYLNNVCKRTLQQRVLLLFQTLGNLIGQGASRQAQETATLVLAHLMEVVHNVKDITFQKEVVKDFFTLYVRSQVDHSGLYSSMFYMLKSLTIQSFTNNQIAILDKALQTISNNKLNYRVSKSLILRRASAPATS